MPFLFKRSNGFYYICYEVDGRRKWRSTGKIHKAEAYKEMMQLENHLKTSKNATTLHQFIKDFLSHAETTYAAKTRELYVHAFNKLYLQVGNKSLSAITPREADQYRSIRAKVVSPVSVNIELRCLKAAFSLAVRWKLISESPFKSVSSVRVPDQQPVYIRKEEFAKFIMTIQDDWFRDIVVFAVLTGMRRGEIINLRWENVDFERRLVQVRNSEDFKTKTGKTRTVPMNENVFQLLQRRSQSVSTDLVFTFEDKKIRGDFVTKKMRHYSRKAGLNQKVHFHSLRHTFATWLVQGRVSIYEVQKLLGHSSISVTQVYSHLSPSELHDAVGTLQVETWPADGS